MLESRFNEGRKSEGYIYFVKDRLTGMVKIGETKQLERRLNNLYNQLPGEIDLLHVIKVNECLRAERSFHYHFKDKRFKNEWFALTDEDIKGLQSGQYPKVANDLLIAEIPISMLNLTFIIKKKS